MSLVNRFRKDGAKVSAITSLMIFATPLVAMAAEAEVAAGATDPKVLMVKYASAGAAMSISALGAAYAQGKIGSAAAGTLAENPEAATTLIVLQALPEIIVLLGFVSALIISG